MGYDPFTGKSARPSGQEFTGRFLVLCRENDPGVARTLQARAGLRIASSSDFHQGAVDVAGLAGADGVYLEALGVAVTSSMPDQVRPLVASAGTSGVLAVEPERVVYILDAIPRPDRPPGMLPARAPDLSWRGGGTMESVACAMAPTGLMRIAADAVDESTRTWGLGCTRAGDSTMTGRGIRVAVLDTGLDLNHPDFAGRRVASQSFVTGEAVQDGNKHGTHCAGTAVGPSRPGTMPRYGIACDAELYVGKVMNNQGRGQDGNILAGINWALTNGCRVISMSIGAPPGDTYSQVFENVAKRALDANALILCAAGNSSERPGQIAPVEHPANCPSIMAVGAVDSDLQITSFSTRRFNTEGGAVDIVAPGLQIYSTVPMPRRYDRLNGTRMATPHVAGIAALYAQANPNATARQIWQLLTSNARSLDLSQDDSGAGLVQAPV